jgi:hypothetical protein
MLPPPVPAEPLPTSSARAPPPASSLHAAPAQPLPSSPPPRTPIYTPTPAANRGRPQVIIPLALQPGAISSPVEVVDLTTTSPFGTNLAPVTMSSSEAISSTATISSTTASSGISADSTQPTGQAENDISTKEARRRSTRIAAGHRRPNLSGEVPVPKRQSTRGRGGHIAQNLGRQGARALSGDHGGSRDRPGLQV